MLLTIIFSAIGLLIVSYIVPGFVIDSFWSAVIVAVILGLVNAFIRPLILLLTLPINIVTLGLFTLIINGLMLMLVAAIVPGFAVSGLWAAILASIVLWLVSMVTQGFTKAVTRQVPRSI
jgi:putative membrane protein